MPHAYRHARRTRPISSSVAIVLTAAAVAACSGTSSNSGGADVNAPGRDGVGRTPTITGGGDGEIGTNGGGPGGAAVCAPSPANYEIPDNGCDDDGDGQVDAIAPCDASLPVTGDAAAFVKALGLCKTATGSSWGLVSAKYTRGVGTSAAPADGQHGILQEFGQSVKPREGASLGVLSTGFAREFDRDDGGSTPQFPNLPGFPGGDLSGAFQGGQTMTDGGAVPPGYPKPAAGCKIASDVHDVAALELEIKVPENARGLAFDFDFYSGEWPEFVCTEFNDGFAAFLQSKATAGTPDQNISFDAKHNPVSVNNGFFDRCTPDTETGCEGGTKKTASCPGGEAELAGTGFAERDQYCGNKESSGGGATGWLTSTAPVEPGETIKLSFVIWDTGDAAYDSSVLLDHLTWEPGPTETKTERPK